MAIPTANRPKGRSIKNLRMVWGFALRYPVVADEGHAISNRYRVFALPTLVVVDRRGVIVEMSVADTETAERKVLELLGQR